MRVLFDILSLLLLLASLGSCVVSKSAIQETVGILLLIAAAIFAVGGAILKEIQDLRRQLPPPSNP